MLKVIRDFLPVTQNRAKFITSKSLAGLGKTFFAGVAPNTNQMEEVFLLDPTGIL